MYAFTQHRPGTVRQAAGLLAKQEEAKLLAGGHTLIPTMKLRLAGPKHLVDLSKVEGLTGIEMKGRSLVIGAMTPHAEVANAAVVKENIPALAHLAGLIGDPAVRHRGTIGGSIANNDPNADYPAGALGLGATIITNKRRIGADEFFKGMFETALEPDEIITKVQFPKANKAAYQKFPNPASRYALVGVFVSKRGSDIRVAVTGAGAGGVFRVNSFEEALKKRFGPKSLEGMTVLAISVLGTFAVMQLWVTALLPELAVRRAVGARRRHILVYVLLRAGAVGAFGVCLGVLVGEMSSDPLASLLGGLPLWDLTLVPRPALALVAAALLGGLIPAWRAARSDPARLMARLTGP